MSSEEDVALLRHYRVRHEQLMQSNALLERLRQGLESKVAELEKKLREKK